MAWLEKRKRYRIRDWVNGKKTTVIADVGIWKELAEARLTEYRKTKAAGSEISILNARHLVAAEACDIFFKHHSPSLAASTQYDLKCRMTVIKKAWEGVLFHDLTPYHVRDFLSKFRTVGNRMKYLRVLTTIFKLFARWNKDGKVLGFMVKLPSGNPASEWRAEMKPHQKKELPLHRVLSPEEWQRLRPHLTKRAAAICELALCRFLRTGDIKRLTCLNISGGQIRGLQAKTGEPFIIPVLETQPKKYDFRNFRKEFQRAQMASGLFYPKGHPLHFSVRDLRRTGATWGYRATKDLKGISLMLGHTNTRTTERYLGLDESDLRSIAKAVDELAGHRSGGASVGQETVIGHK